jgi:hypothetical protein
MRRTRFAIFVVSAVAASGCGGGPTFANKPRPPTPVNLTVYINDSRVSVSPSSVGAGPVVFIVTNAGTHNQSLIVQSPGGNQTLANTGAINPQATAQVTIDFADPGNYSVAAGNPGTTEAAQASHAASPIQPATLHIGPPRPSGSNALLQP